MKNQWISPNIIQDCTNIVIGHHQQETSLNKIRIPSFWFFWSDLLLFNANSAIFQLYHGQNKLILNEMMMRSALYQTNTLSWNFIMLAQLKQDSTERHFAPLGHIILIPIQPVCSFCVLNRKQPIPILLSFCPDQIGARTYDLPHSRRAR